MNIELNALTNHILSMNSKNDIANIDVDFQVEYYKNKDKKNSPLVFDLDLYREALENAKKIVLKDHVSKYGNNAKVIFNIDEEIRKAVENNNKELEKSLEEKRYNILFN